MCRLAAITAVSVIANMSVTVRAAYTPIPPDGSVDFKIQNKYACLPLEMRTTRKCPKGMIRRKTAKTKSPGPSPCRPGIGPLKAGELSRFGYDHVVMMTATKRQVALRKAQAEYGSLSLFRKLNALYVYTRNSSPASSAIFLMDRNWVRSTFGFKG